MIVKEAEYIWIFSFEKSRIESYVREAAKVSQRNLLTYPIEPFLCLNVFNFCTVFDRILEYVIYNDQFNLFTLKEIP